MKVPIHLPDLGTDRVKFSLWYVRDGDYIVEGDRLAEVLIPGATVDLHAAATGQLAERVAFPNDDLSPGQTLGWIESEERQRSADQPDH